MQSQAESVLSITAYILNNPVRKTLVRENEECKQCNWMTEIQRRDRSPYIRKLGVLNKGKIIDAVTAFIMAGVTWGQRLYGVYW
jgi:hypothetical protein